MRPHLFSQLLWVWWRPRTRSRCPLRTWWWWRPTVAVTVMTPVRLRSYSSSSPSPLGMYWSQDYRWKVQSTAKLNGIKTHLQWRQMISLMVTRSALPESDVRTPTVFFFRDESAETDAAVMAVEAHPGKRLLEWCPGKLKWWSDAEVEQITSQKFFFFSLLQSKQTETMWKSAVPLHAETVKLCC